MDEKRPCWQHTCEFCLACFNWCPQEAMESSELTKVASYRHPEVQIADMLKRNLPSL